MKRKLKREKSNVNIGNDSLILDEVFTNISQLG